MLFSKTPGLVDPAGAVLSSGKFEKLSIAEVLGLSNEQPAAAVETLEGVPQGDDEAPVAEGEPVAVAEGGSEEPEAGA